MRFNTIEEYRKQILSVYIKSKGGGLSGYLSNPTPSQIRDACVYIFKKKLSKSDQEIISVFFGFSEEENGIRTIEQYKPGKLRAISDFLKGKSKTNNSRRLDLIALLVDFEPRPYSKFQKIENPITSKNIWKEDILTAIGSFSKSTSNPVVSEKEKSRSETINEAKASVKKKWSSPLFIKIITVVGLVSFVLGVLHLGRNRQTERCMSWFGDHYKKVPCEENNNFKTENLDINLLENFRKIEVDTNDVFFNKGVPLVWYAWYNDKIEFFNMKGVHPILNDSLKPVNEIIISRYVYGEE